jgi:MFS family permease
MRLPKRLLVNLVYWRDAEMIYDGRRPDMDRLMLQSFCANIYAVLTTGVFLAGYLIYLGAPEWLVGYAGMIPSVCCMAAPFFAGMVEARERRRTLTICLSAMQKLLFCLILAVPLVVGRTVAVPVVCFLLVASLSIGGLYGLSLNTIFLKLIPVRFRGRYLSARQVILTLVNAAFPIAAGRIVDSFGGGYAGFLVIYVAALVASAVECVFISRVSDPVFGGAKARMKLRNFLVIPLRNRAFMGFTVRIGLFYLFLNLGASFSYVYMISYLKLSYTYINVLATALAVLQILLLYRYWGRVNDRISANFTMLAAGWLFLPELLAWALLTPHTAPFLLPLIYLASSLNLSGFTIGSFNRRYEVTPTEGFSYYDTFTSASIGLAYLISPAAAALLRGWAASWPALRGMQYGHVRVVYAISLLLIFALQVATLRGVRRDSPGDPILAKKSYARALAILRESIFG